MIKEELRKKERDMSVLTIGPAGENLVRYACISVDKGHMLAHNGFGAVMGSKKLKAIAVDRSNKSTIPIKDKEGLSRLAKHVREYSLGEGGYESCSKWGTLHYFKLLHEMGGLPVKNYTTSIFTSSPSELEEYSPEHI